MGDNCYFSKKNLKANAWFFKNGYTFHLAKHTGMLSGWSYEVYYVDNFNGSGTEFHKLMVDNGLLMSQQ
jgi:hypothetical protein